MPILGNILSIPTNTRQSWSRYWNTLIAQGKVDFRATGIEADGLTLTSPVGSGGVLKQMPCVALTNAGQAAYRCTNKSLMLDESSVYEYYLETIIDAFQPPSRRDFMSSRTFVPGPGFMFTTEGVTADGFYLYLYDGSTYQDLNKLSEHVLIVGLNTIKITFNLPAKLVTVVVNGTTYTKTYTFTSFKNTVGQVMAIGGAAYAADQKPVYYKFTQDGVIKDEVIFGSLYGADGLTLAAHDLINTSSFSKFGTSSLSTQDLVNPYRNGYDLYWIEDTLKYQGISAINSLGTSKNPNTWGDTYQGETYPLFKKVLPSELGYHILNYIEMPDLPIFDTTDRNVWKASIESDAYYVGGTAGRERWFHKTWLDFDWINDHIEDAYKGLLFVQCRWKRAVGQDDYVKIKIENIVVLNEAQSRLSTRRDYYEDAVISSYYESFNMRADDGMRYQQYDSVGLKKVIVVGNYLKYSSDGGHTYNAGVDISSLYPVAEIASVRILANGNIVIFSKKTKVHYSDDNLTSLKESSVVNADNSPYVFHTPANALYPGNYFSILNSFVETDDCIVIGNYSSSDFGASPVNFYYSIDSGVTWKVFYTYGQNPAKTDNGTATGGEGGALLGDAGNTIITTRVEGINLGSDGCFYVGTEGNTTGGGLCHSIMKCEYNTITDTWTVTPLLNATSVQWERMRANGCYEKNGYIYWSSAGVNEFSYNGHTYSSQGIWKSLVAEINDLSKHILLSSPRVSTYLRGCMAFVYNPITNKAMVQIGGTSVSSDDQEIHFSADGGDTWEIFNKKTTGIQMPLMRNNVDDLFYMSRYAIFKYLK